MLVGKEILSVFMNFIVPDISALCSVNISLGPKEDRVLITRLHTVADVCRMLKERDC